MGGGGIRAEQRHRVFKQLRFPKYRASQDEEKTEGGPFLE